MASPSSGACAEPGVRVQILKDRATVRYLGSVRGQEGTWVGVEWDDPSRGKHDGTTGGVRYFACASGHPTAGSFVRAEKVGFGVSVLDALTARYTGAKGELGDVDASELWVPTAHNRRVQIELVGEGKIAAQQRQIQHLPSARVVGAAVSHLGDPQQLSASLPSLTELDLTCNLLHSWDVAQGLCVALPNLKILNLSDNRIVLPAGVEGRPSLPGLRALVLNDCLVSWHQVLAIEPLLPNLQELHLCGNNIACLHRHQHASAAAGGLSQRQEQALEQQPQQQEAAGSSSFRSLEVLSLEDNQLCDWSEVLALAHLPRLAKLHLSNNPLREVSYPGSNAPAAVAATAAAATGPASSGGGETGPKPEDGASSSGGGGNGGAAAGADGVQFGCLQQLLLGGCQLAAWSSIDQLGRFPALKDLRVTGNPVLQLSKSGGRFEIIGRVKGLESLNGAAVLPRERRDAELRYLQNILAEMEEAPDADARALVPQLHPRYQELMQRYGSVLGTIGRTQHGTTLASSMLEIKLTCVAAAKNAKMGTQVKKLPRSITVNALKLLCEKLFKVKGAHMTLFMKQPGDPMPEDIGNEDDKTLASLGAQDGFEILVDEFDPEERRKQDERAREAEAVARAAREADQDRAAELVANELAKAMAF